VAGVLQTADHLEDGSRNEAGLERGGSAHTWMVQ